MHGRFQRPARVTSTYLPLMLIALNLVCKLPALMEAVLIRDSNAKLIPLLVYMVLLNLSLIFLKLSL